MAYETPATAAALTQTPAKPRPALDGFYDHALARFIAPTTWEPCLLPTPDEARAIFAKMREDRKIGPAPRTIYMHPAEVDDLIRGPL